MRIHKILGIISAILLSLIMILTVSAEKYLDSEGTTFEIILNEDGSADITESWRYFYGGETITRYTRSYINSDKYTISNISAKLDGEILNIIQGKDDSRPLNTAAVYQENGMTNIDIYQNSLNVSRTIELSYRVNNAVIIGDDVGEFRWNITSDNEAVDISSITGKVRIPKGGDMESVKIWAHGPSNGTFTKASGELFKLSVGDISKNQAVVIRLAMPKELFPTATRFESGVTAETIQNEENSYSYGNKVEEIGIWMIFVALGLGFIDILVIKPIYNKLIRPIIINSKRVKIPEIPFDENNIQLPKGISAGACGVLEHYYDGKEPKFKNLFTSALLDLAFKDVISFRQENGKTVIIAKKKQLINPL